MRIIFFTFFMIFITALSFAQSPYDVSLIPKELLPLASAIVRDENITIEVKDLDYVTYHVKKAITVLNSNGDKKVDIDVQYDNIISVRYIKGFIYNEFGKVQQKISESDFDDYAISDGFSLFQDDRIKHFKKASNQYPYTIEYEYELKERQSLFFESWMPNWLTNVSVEKSIYTFICPPNFNMRYKEYNLPNKLITFTASDKRRFYQWSVNNIKPWRGEPMGPNQEQNLIKVVVAPEKFYFDKHSGSFTNWQQLGKWVYDDLLKGRSDVPEPTIQYIKELTANITDPKLKAKKIYEYMQQKTRYVSVQVGIGGFQPFLASDVDKQGYGDCKALVNYTRSLLKIAGIESYYCLVWGNHQNKRNILTDFASMQGNHIILCIPFKNDTTWLECTSQQSPFGYLGDFTDDRTVLACTPDGGKLMHTPKYTFDENLKKRTAEFRINEAGELDGKMETIFKGTDYDDRYEVIEKTGSERVKEIKRYYPINNMEIEKLDYKQDKSVKPVTTETIKFLANEYAAVNDGKIYFSLNSVDRYPNPPRQVRNRENPVYVLRGYTQEDEIIYTLPKGYHLSSEPINVSLDKAFGSYKATVTLKGDQLVYTRKLQVKDGVFDKAAYPDMVDFYQSVVDADNYNVALAKN